MALQVIGAGYGRTGTKSLQLALEKLGFERYVKPEAYEAAGTSSCGTSCGDSSKKKEQAKPASSCFRSRWVSHSSRDARSRAAAAATVCSEMILSVGAEFIFSIVLFLSFVVSIDDLSRDDSPAVAPGRHLSTSAAFVPSPRTYIMEPTPTSGFL